MNKPELVSFEEIFSVFKRALFELKSVILISPNKRLGQQNGCFYKMKLLERINGNNEMRNDDCLDDELIRDVFEESIEFDFMQSNDQSMKNLVNVDESSNNLTSKTNDNLELKDDLESINFQRILMILQIYIGLLCKLRPFMTENQLFRFKKAVYQLVKLNPKNSTNGFSLLHQVSLKDESCQMIKFPICDLPTNEIIRILLVSTLFYNFSFVTSSKN